MPDRGTGTKFLPVLPGERTFEFVSLREELRFPRLAPKCHWLPESL